MTYNIIYNSVEQIGTRDFKIIDNSNNDVKEVFLSKSINMYVEKMKGKIDELQNSWDSIKKYVNPYEFIHTRIPNEKYSVCKYVPISRSFFKLIEIFDYIQLGKSLQYKSISSLHLAEAPGGFIEAMHYYVKNTDIGLNRCVGLSLIDNVTGTPSWNKPYINKLSRTTIEYGKNNCDLTNSENYLYLKNKYTEKFDIITGDGGFDFSIDFNKQEMLCVPLIFAECLYAITFQKAHGIFILKMFDIFTRPSAEILYLLSSLYERIYIYKPNTSRAANSEKYLICKNFICTEENRKELIERIPYLLKSCGNMSSFLDFDLSLLFKNRVEDINAILGQQQLENISATITLIGHKSQKEKLESLKQNNVQKCINWCIKHRFNYNTLG